MAKKWIGVLVVIAVGLSGCKADSDKTPANRQPTTERLEATVRSYTRAYLGLGSGGLAYALLSPRCRAKITRADFDAIVEQAHAAYGDVTITKLEVTVNGNTGTATYELSAPELNQTNERWVFVHEGSDADSVDAWRKDDCDDDANGSGLATSTSASIVRRGSRSTPIARGDVGPVQGGGWDLRVVSTTPNANDAVRRENQFNDPPAAGKQFFMVRVALTRTGSDPGDPSSVDLRAIGTGNVTYDTRQDSCGVIPDPIPAKDVYPGGTVEANACWQVQVGDAPTLQLIARVLYSDVEGTFFALA